MTSTPNITTLKIDDHDVSARQDETILEVAQLDDYDLIVMGTHGRGRHHFFTGSVADRVVRGATCPVLTVHSAPIAPSVRPESPASSGRADGAKGV